MIKNFQSKENQKGQVVIILLLVIVVGLAVGLTVVGRSVTEISTSTKTEQSSRAFSAAEAGIEKILQQNPSLGSTGSVPNITFNNQSQAQQIEWNADLPETQKALEYPPFGKESFAQFWLANPSNLAASYDRSSFDIYFGDKSQDYSSGKENNQPAIEVHLIYRDGSNGYKSLKKFIDSYSTRVPANSFDTCSSPASPIETNDSGSNDRWFYCEASFSGYPLDISNNIYPVMVRVRILYTNTAHPVAIQPTSGGSLPKQSQIYRSTGTAGDVARTLEVFRQKSVMPQLFDYVLFSAGDLSK